MVNKDVFSIPQAARFCAMSRGSIWKYVKSGELKASLTPGGQYRILKKDLEFFGNVQKCLHGDILKTFIEQIRSL
ncbi:MAG: helix-turn-helix domain-containing protein [Deltaproteobacteria bacterium]|nr:helix-turn-helix domain-containing protein [Deltaproteobacteria bacterium]MBW2119394.1 helix-turn-helix domain-containing protein [Deltaproteobacteria bacterium]